jgi:hypothetical protein
VKSILPRLPLALSAAALFLAAARERNEPALFLKSVYAGTRHFLRKAFSRNIVAILARFYRATSDEPIIALLLGHLEVVRQLNLPGPRALTQRHPNYVNKYMTEYLAKDFGQKSRRKILQFHHQYLIRHLIESFYDQVLQNKPILWQEKIDQNNYAISISFNSVWHSEGDLSLTFDRDGLSLYEISFSVVPGELVGSEAGQVLLIGRVQGRKGQAEAIKLSTKACYDIAPPHLLVTAAESIASVLAINVIGGVSNGQQIAKSVFDAQGCYFDYDAFWEKHLVRNKPANIYIISIPFPEKPIEQISATHRRRTRMKRRLRKQIGATIGETFAKMFLKSRQGITSDASTPPATPNTAREINFALQSTNMALTKEDADL